MKTQQTVIIGISIIMSLVLCVQHTFASDRPVTEKCDAIYRFGAAGFGHAGLYYRYIDYLDAEDIYSHTTIESNSYGRFSEDPGVTQDNFGRFHDLTIFWGVRTSEDLDYLRRLRIMYSARAQLGCPYNFFQGYKNPASRPGAADGSFRCDGLVEFCYESAGIDIMPNDWPTPPVPFGHTLLTPRRQMNRLHVRSLKEEKDVVPIVIIASPSEGGEYISGIYELSAFATDGIKGSGITKVEFWLGEPDDTPHIHPGYLMGDDMTDVVIDGNYSYLLDTTQYPDGEYTIYAKAFDQAGNTKVSEGVDIIIDNIFLFTGIWIGKYSSWFGQPGWGPPGDYKLTIESKFFINDINGVEEIHADSFDFKTPSGTVYHSDSYKLNLGLAAHQFEAIFTDGVYEMTANVTVIDDEGVEKTYEVTERFEKDDSINFLRIPYLASISPPSGSTVPVGTVDISLDWDSVPGASDYYLDFGAQGPPYVVYNCPSTSHTFYNVPVPQEDSTYGWSIYICAETIYRVPRDRLIEPFRLNLNSVYWNADGYQLHTPSPDE